MDKVIAKPWPSPHRARALEPISSRLCLQDPRYRPIVVEFIDTLGDRLLAMETAHAQDDRSALARLAHTLKGTGGSVGFSEFIGPCEWLKLASNEGSAAEIEHALAELRSLAARLVVPESTSDEPAASARTGDA